MREIRFRGKRTDNGEWVYGGIEQSKLVTLIYDMELPYCNQVSVIPETVGQFTGLHDKNGKPIYEGDVVSFYTSFFGENKGYIVMNSGSWMIWDEDVEEFLSNVCARPDGAWCEVIGNIHDKAGDEPSNFVSVEFDPMLGQSESED